jgi:hypothetical protein
MIFNLTGLGVYNVLAMLVLKTPPRYTMPSAPCKWPGAFEPDNFSHLNHLLQTPSCVCNVIEGMYGVLPSVVSTDHHQMVVGGPLLC